MSETARAVTERDANEHAVEWTENGGAQPPSQDSKHEPTGILLIGDHPLYRSALRTVIESRPEFRIVAESTSAVATPAPNVDVVLVDFEEPDRILPLGLSDQSLGDIELRMLVINGKHIVDRGERDGTGGVALRVRPMGCSERSRGDNHFLAVLSSVFGVSNE